MTTATHFPITRAGLRLQVLNVATTIVRLAGTKSNGRWQGIVSAVDVARVIAVHPITVDDVTDALDTLHALGAIERRESGLYSVVVP